MFTRIAALFVLSASTAFAGTGQVLPLHFEANRGQGDPASQFVAAVPGYEVAATPQGLAFRSWQAAQPELTIQFPGAGHWLGLESAPGTVNYLLGDARDWVTGVDAFARLLRPEVADGIDCRVQVSGRNIEFEFVLAPHANPADARFSVAGAACVAVQASGGLAIEAAGAAFELKAPFAYQLAGAARQAVPVRYEVDEHGEVSFRLGAYDPARRLYIDPVVQFATYIGGDETRGGTVNGFESAEAVATDRDGNLYVAGTTFARNLPTFNALNPGPLGNPVFQNSEIFLAKYGPDRSLVYLTYLGGSGSDIVADIAVDAAGAVYLTGSTDSANFPAVNRLPGVPGGGRDAFVTVLNPAGTAIIFSSKLGGAGTDGGTAVAVDGTGHAYVTGFTGSNNFPTVNPIQDRREGSLNAAFVARIDTVNGSLRYATYLGGSGRVIGDRGEGIAIDGNGSAVVVGTTGSGDFPLASPQQAALRGLQDGFVTRIGPNGQLLSSTYLGGASTAVGLVGNTACTGVAIGPDGSVYVLGHTSAVDLPVSFNGLQPGLLAPFAAFVVKYQAFGNTIAGGTYLGSPSGVGSTFSAAIDVNAQGQVAVAGISAALDYPVVNPVSPDLAGSFDLIVSVLDASLSSFSFSTYYGGPRREDATDIAFGDEGTTLAVTGKTIGAIPLVNPTQAARSGNVEGFVVEFDLTADPGEGEPDGEGEGEGLPEGEGMVEGEPEGIALPCDDVCPGTGLDSDGDGLDDNCERCLGTDPFLPDTNGNGMSDFFEWVHGFDPLNPGSTPGRRDGPNDDFDGDGLTNLQEFWLGSDPRDPNDPNRVFFVATNGLDEPMGGTREAPWATVNFALSQLNPSPAFPVRILLEPGVYTEDIDLVPGVTLASVQDARAVVQGTIEGANSARLERLAIVAQAPGDVLLRLDGVDTTVSNVTFQGGNQANVTAIRALGASGQATVSDCTFSRLHHAIEIQGELPILRRSVFTRLTGSGVLVRNGDKRFTSVAKSFGNAQDPSTGFNTFRQDIDGPAVVNEREEPVAVQLADWDLNPPIDPEDIAARIDGPADFNLFLPRGAAILASAFFCTVVDQETQERLEEASVALRISTYPPNTNNQTGVYPFPAIPDGTYSVVVEAEGYQRRTRDLILAPGQTKSMIVALRPEDAGPPPPPPGCACPGGGAEAKGTPQVHALAGDMFVVTASLMLLGGLGYLRTRRRH